MTKRTEDFKIFSSPDPMGYRIINNFGMVSHDGRLTTFWGGRKTTAILKSEFEAAVKKEYPEANGVVSYRREPVEPAGPYQRQRYIAEGDAVIIERLP
jgi:hypothetical protein